MLLKECSMLKGDVPPTIILPLLRDIDNTNTFSIINFIFLSP